MRTDGRESDNVEDRRDEGPVGGVGGGGLPIGRLGIGGVAVALVASYFLGIDPRLVLGLLSGVNTGPPPAQQTQHGPAPKPTDPTGRFVAVVLADTEDTWTALFREKGRTYQPPKLDLYRDSYPTACGQGRAAAGPF